jgi:hypothetical protein
MVVALPCHRILSHFRVNCCMSRHQRGYIYEAFGAFHVRFYLNEIVEGQTVRKQRSHRLCSKDRSTGHGSKSATAVRALCEDFMRSINQHRQDAHSLEQDMMVASFWESIYLPHCEKVLPVTGQPRLKASTLRGYKGIWEKHLKKHFGTVTLQRYDSGQCQLVARLAHQHNEQHIVEACKGGRLCHLQTCGC